MILGMATLAERLAEAMQAQPTLTPAEIDRRVARALGLKEKGMNALTAEILTEGRVPKADRVLALAGALGVRVGWLLGEEGEQHPVAPLDDPRPEVTAAAAFARANGVREDAIEDIASRFQRGGRKLTPEEWFHRMRARGWEMDEEDAGRGTTTLTPPTGFLARPGEPPKKRR